MSGPRLLLVEDDAGTREALEVGLEAFGIRVVLAAASGEEALARLDSVDAEAVLVDLDLPGMDGVATIRALRQRRPGIPAMVLTVYEDPERIVSAIEAGASGYLLKGIDIRALRDAIADLVAGLSPIAPAVARHLLVRLRAGGEAAARVRVDLSARELEVLDLLTRGHTYAAIASALEVRPGTVHGYVRSLYRKLEVASKAEATSAGISLGLVPPRR